MRRGGDDEMLRALGSLGKDGGEGQIAVGPISFLMATERGDMRETGDLEGKEGRPHPLPSPHLTWTKHAHQNTSHLEKGNGWSRMSIIIHVKSTHEGKP